MEMAGLITFIVTGSIIALALLALLGWAIYYAIRGKDPDRREGAQIFLAVAGLCAFLGAFIWGVGVTFGS